MTQPQDFEANDTSLMCIVHTSQINLWAQIAWFERLKTTLQEFGFKDRNCIAVGVYG